MAKSRWVTIMAWLLGGFLVAYAYAFVTATSADSEDTTGCPAIVSIVSDGHSIPLSVSEPGRPAAFCDFGVHFPLLRSYYTVFIYGVMDKGQQEAIVRDLRRFHRTDGGKRILVQFFEKENWKTWTDAGSGRSGGSRGPESAVAKVWVE